MPEIGSADCEIPVFREMSFSKNFGNILTEKPGITIKNQKNLSEKMGFVNRFTL